MPPVCLLCPEKTCHNYPLCTRLQFRPSGTPRPPRKDFCKSCLESCPPCDFPGCQNPSAPPAGKITAPVSCTFHYKDPARQSSCQWKRCINEGIGCKELARKNTSRETKCYACAKNELPCLHALTGCPNHVLAKKVGTSLKQDACCNRHDGCLYAVSRMGTCSSKGCTCAVMATGNVCKLCSDGQVLFVHVPLLIDPQFLCIGSVLASSSFNNCQHAAHLPARDYYACMTACRQCSPSV